MADTLTRNQKAYRRKLEREANAERTPARLTADPAKASTIRDPATGEILKSTSPKGAKCLMIYSPSR
jgi:hypothetical protein